MSKQTASTCIEGNIFTKCYYRGTDFQGAVVDNDFIREEFENQMKAYEIGIACKPLKYYINYRKEKFDDDDEENENGEYESEYCIDMELIDGMDLEEYKKYDECVDEKEMIKYVSDMLDDGLSETLKNLCLKHLYVDGMMAIKIL